MISAQEEWREPGTRTWLEAAEVSQRLVYEKRLSRARELPATLHWRRFWSRYRLDRLAFLVCGHHAWQNTFFASWCLLTLQSCLPPPCPGANTLPVPRSISAARRWCNWAVGTYCWAALPVFDQTFLLPPLWRWAMVPFMVDRLWRAVSIVFSGRVNIPFTHACTIKNFSTDIVFKSSLGHLSRPGDLPGFNQYSTYFAISLLVSVPRNVPCCATSNSACVTFELGHQLQRCHCSFVVLELCDFSWTYFSFPKSKAKYVNVKPRSRIEIESELHRPSIKGTKLFNVIKAIIITIPSWSHGLPSEPPS